jgi:hypothetical protein
MKISLEIIQSNYQSVLNDIKLDNKKILEDAQKTFALCWDNFHEFYAEKNYNDLIILFHIAETLINKFPEEFISFTGNKKYIILLKEVLFAIAGTPINGLYSQDELLFCLDIVKNNNINDAMVYTAIGNMITSNSLTDNHISDKYGEMAIDCYKKSIILGNISNLLFYATSYNGNFEFYKTYHDSIFNLFLLEIEGDSYLNIDPQYAIIKYIFDSTKFVTDHNLKGGLRYVLLRRDY